MKVIIFGGDGFCGWPTSLYLSDKGHQVTIVDNLSRRKIDIDLEVNSLTPIQPIHTRLAAWKEISTKNINFINGRKHKIKKTVIKKQEIIFNFMFV